MMASEAIANLTGAPYSQSPQAVPTLPTLLVTTPGGYVHEILRPVRRPAVRYSPAAIRRLQAARHAESPVAAATLLDEKEEPVVEVQKLLSSRKCGIHSNVISHPKSKRRRANLLKRRPEPRRSELL